MLGVVVVCECAGLVYTVRVCKMSSCREYVHQPTTPLPKRTITPIPCFALVLLVHLVFFPSTVPPLPACLHLVVPEHHPDTSNQAALLAWMVGGMHVELVKKCVLYMHPNNNTYFLMPAFSATDCSSSRWRSSSICLRSSSRRFFSASASCSFFHLISRFWGRAGCQYFLLRKPSCVDVERGACVLTVVPSTCHAVLPYAVPLLQAWLLK